MNFRREYARGPRDGTGVSISTVDDVCIDHVNDTDNDHEHENENEHSHHTDKEWTWSSE